MGNELGRAIAAMGKIQCKQMSYRNMPGKILGAMIWDNVITNTDQTKESELPYTGVEVLSKNRSYVEFNTSDEVTLANTLFIFCDQHKLAFTVKDDVFYIKDREADAPETPDNQHANAVTIQATVEMDASQLDEAIKKMEQLRGGLRECHRLMMRMWPNTISHGGGGGRG